MFGARSPKQARLTGSAGFIGLVGSIETTPRTSGCCHFYPAERTNPRPVDR
jgi:hypothetical protein